MKDFAGERPESSRVGGFGRPAPRTRQGSMILPRIAESARGFEDSLARRRDHGKVGRFECPVPGLRQGSMIPPPSAENDQGSRTSPRRAENEHRLVGRCSFSNSDKLRRIQRKFVDARDGDRSAGIVRTGKSPRLGYQ